jgi:hypothetical protein
VSRSVFSILAAGVTVGGLLAVVLAARAIERRAPTQTRRFAMAFLLAYGVVLLTRPTAWPVIDLAVLAGAVGGVLLLERGLATPGAVGVFLAVAAVVDVVSVSGGLSRALIKGYRTGASDLLLYLTLTVPVRGRAIPIVGIGDLLVGGAAAAALRTLARRSAGPAVHRRRRVRPAERVPATVQGRHHPSRNKGSELLKSDASDFNNSDPLILDLLASIRDGSALDAARGGAPADRRQQLNQVLLHPLGALVFGERSSTHRGGARVVIAPGDESQRVAAIPHVRVERPEWIGIAGPDELRVVGEADNECSAVVTRCRFMELGDEVGGRTGARPG